MDKSVQSEKAERLLTLHYDARLLVLPNIWDPLGARLLESLGYPAVATASAAVAYSMGCDDGEHIGFDNMLTVIERVARSVDVPLTADIEGGYSMTPEGVAENISRVIEAGATGVNLEDSVIEGEPLRAVAAQCERLAAARAAARDSGVPLVINARIDTFLVKGDSSHEERLEETIVRAVAYRDAGVDCVYPIGLGDMDSLNTLRAAVDTPINVYANAAAAPMRELEAAGINRLSIGAGMLRASLTNMKNVAETLANYGTYDSFTTDAIPGSEVKSFITKAGS